MDVFNLKLLIVKVGKLDVCGRLTPIRKSSYSLCMHISTAYKAMAKTPQSKSVQSIPFCFLLADNQLDAALSNGLKFKEICKNNLHVISRLIKTFH